MQQPFHQFLQQSTEAKYGLWLGMANPSASEICAGCGFDWLLIDAEHGPNTLTTVLEQLRALSHFPTPIITRLPEGQTALIKQYLDIGAHNLLIPMVETTDQAFALAQAMRYPPQGIRGLGTSMARAAHYNQDTDYLQSANDRVCLIVQIETTLGLENIAEICAVEGIDAVFIGPSDLSASMGYLGQPDHPQVVEAIEGAIKICQKANVAAGVLALQASLVERYREIGAKFIGIGVDTLLLSGAARELIQTYSNNKQGNDKDILRY